MRISVSASGNHLKPADVDRIERDLEKIGRRLHEYNVVEANVRITDSAGAPGYRVAVELDYGRNHLIAKADGGDMGQALREARDEILRQIKDRSRRGHSSFAKGR